MTLIMCGIVSPNCLIPSRVNLFGRVGARAVLNFSRGVAKLA